MANVTGTCGANSGNGNTEADLTPIVGVLTKNIAVVPNLAMFFSRNSSSKFMKWRKSEKIKIEDIKIIYILTIGLLDKID